MTAASGLEGFTAIMVTVTLRNVPVEVFDKINRELGAVDNPLSGLVVHFVHPVGSDAVRIIDVWMSEDVHDAYDEAHDPPGALARILRRPRSRPTGTR